MARGNRSEAVESLNLDLQAIKADNKRLKTESVRTQSLVAEFAEAVRLNGGQVYFAQTGREAIAYVLGLAEKTETKLIAKSKSLTSDEIEFNRGIEGEGIRVVETDLGELIIQLANELPVHLVYPAAHKSVEDVAEMISEEVGEYVPADHEAILKVIRRHLRPIFFSAGIGVTGANIGIAETGSILVETNEGNGRLVTSLPRIHVAIIGMEKIVPSWSDAAQLVNAHAISASGQMTTTYVSIITQHIQLGGSAEGREFHVIILDNGRSKMKSDPWFSEALNCIRCGACLNVCPTYGITTGHTFGHIYPGPIGIPWTANVHGIDKATFAHLCVSCGLCKEICPVDIDMPMMIAKVKEQENELNGQLFVNEFFGASESLAKAASATAPLSNWILRRSSIRYLMEKAVGIDRRRALPPFSRRRLRSRLADVTRGSGAAGRVVFFPDIYADYNDPDLGLRAVSLLESAGFKVEVPDLMWSGMPYISYGELKKATKVAEYNLEILSAYVGQGYKIVSTEPTAIYMFREVYPKLVRREASAALAENSLEFFELINQSGLRVKPSYPTNSPIGFHIPCHERALSGGKQAKIFLERAGYDVQTVETGTCCGMAGTFGLKKGDLGYNLSMAVGEKLFELFRASGLRMIATQSNVCAMQLADGLGTAVLHPLKMVH